jgi:uncharacterized protein
MAERRKQNTSPLCFDLVDLPPEGRELTGTVTPEQLELTEDGVSEFQGDLCFSLRLTAVNSGRDLLVTGAISGTIHANCDRCDEPFTTGVTDDDVCHQYENAFGTTVDLTGDLREDILMALPQRCLCSEECLGLCPMCGQNLNIAECDCEPITDEELAKESGEANPWDELDRLSDK